MEYFELTGRAVLYLVHEPEAARLSSSRTVFFPDGEWVDLFTGETFSGPVTKQIEKPDDAIPLYLRRGGLLLTAEPVSPITRADFERLTVTVCGQGEGKTVLYEDDGRTEEYLDGAFRKTAFTAHTEDGTTTLTVGAAEAPTMLETTAITVAGTTVTLRHKLQTGAKYYTYFTATSLNGGWKAAAASRTQSS